MTTNMTTRTQTCTHEAFIRAHVADAVGHLYVKPLADMTDGELVQLRRARRKAQEAWQNEASQSASMLPMDALDSFLDAYVPAEEIVEVEFQLEATVVV